jgi:hypothetical protein
VACCDAIAYSGHHCIVEHGSKAYLERSIDRLRGSESLTSAWCPRLAVAVSFPCLAMCSYKGCCRGFPSSLAAHTAASCTSTSWCINHSAILWNRHTKVVEVMFRKTKFGVAPLGQCCVQMFEFRHLLIQAGFKRLHALPQASHSSGLV